MITILRKLRKSLIDSGNTRRYLLYAIGEIALVVIGILIALQINNWNEQRLERKSEGKVLLQLKEEIGNNNNQFYRIQRLHTRFFKNVDLILDFMDHQDTSLYSKDTLSNALGWVASTKTATYNPSESVINSLINSGKIDIIKNDTLRNLLIGWKDLIGDFQEEELSLDAFKANHIAPFLAMHVDVFNRGAVMYGNPDTEIWKSRRFKSLLASISQLRYFILVDQGIGEGPQVAENQNQIERLVNSELQKRFSYE